MIGLQQPPGSLAAIANHWWPLLSGDPRIRPGLKCPKIRLITGNDGIAQVWNREPALIEFFSGFLDGIRSDVETLQDLLVEVCLPRGQPRFQSSQFKESFFECIEETAVSFVFLHEIFHIFCGHFYARDVAGIESYDEVSMGADSLVFGGSKKSYQLRLRAYYREIEADNTALQWLMQSHMPIRLKNLLYASRKNGALSISDTASRNREIAFKILLSVVWLVVKRMENARSTRMNMQSPEHPLPGARLLASIFTVLEQFAEIDAVPDESGRKVHHLSSKEKRGIEKFLHVVLKPLLIAPWPTGDMAVIDQGQESFSVWVVLETRNLLLQRPTETPIGQELERVEMLRSAVCAELADFRYFSTGVQR